MRSFVCYVLNVGAAAAFLAGCALPLSLSKGQGDMPPTGVPGAMPRTAARVRQPKSQALLYVSSIYSYYEVNVYTFPQGNLVGPLDIASEPQAMCTDDAGDVFIPEASFNSGIVAEYAHGATDPMRIYEDPDGPYACAIDPTTGNLAVANQNRTIAVFNRRSTAPAPRFYSNSALESYYFTSYDSSGNLFAIAYAFASAYRLYELRQGTSTLQQVKVPFDICCPDWIQWDGHYLAIEVPSKGSGPIVYRLSINNYKATVAGKLTLEGGNNYTAQSWIFGKTLIHPDYYNEDVGFFNYPAGGKAWKSFRSAGTYVIGVTVSKAK